MPLPGGARTRRLRQGEVAVAAAATIAAPSGCRSSARGSPSRPGFVGGEAGGGDDGDDAGLAFGERPGLVDDQRVDALEPLQRGRVQMRIPARAPRPTPTMIAIGVASPNAHGQAMIRTEIAAANA